jgi:hypothetical protein
MTHVLDRVEQDLSRDATVCEARTLMRSAPLTSKNGTSGLWFRQQYVCNPEAIADWMKEYGLFSG